ncbi:glycine-rich RNA-binding protein 2, mitochondrial-like [Tripterygium wilfordii]|uniref:glycine-rich RNA-binding protein 2, mitochondrial-like n=1 Tax=Tripterygium wilfordii TaxID=458696 RepID=UPI0018F852B1|nr:glycine-rich RNA-binding protein 2, mitochondrial-like [Tripterygium wilfordii]XP_038679177.1 glycine-rich RNA-binding protein 2, mitochondrial-like [Tripterygium wilfordii]
MAFFNKLGSLARQSVCQSGNVSVSHMLNSVRNMSSSRLFIGGLSYGTDDRSLKEAFESFGEVTDAKVIVDRDTGRSKGFGFVNFSSTDSASSALSAMDGQELSGRNIRVSYAQERPSGPRSFRGDGGFGGNSGF